MMKIKMTFLNVPEGIDYEKETEGAYDAIRIIAAEMENNEIILSAIQICE